MSVAIKQSEAIPASYHSFRHSVANKLENARINSREIKRLLGHKIGNITFDTYSAEGLGYDVLEDVVGRIEWPDVNWEG
jgi:integrase